MMTTFKCVRARVRVCILLASLFIVNSILPVSVLSLSLNVLS